MSYETGQDLGPIIGGLRYPCLYAFWYSIATFFSICNIIVFYTCFSLNVYLLNYKKGWKKTVEKGEENGGGKEVEKGVEKMDIVSFGIH